MGDWEYSNIENPNMPPCPNCRIGRVQCIWKPMYRCLSCGYSFEARPKNPMPHHSPLTRPWSR